MRKLEQEPEDEWWLHEALKALALAWTGGKGFLRAFSTCQSTLVNPRSRNAVLPTDHAMLTKWTRPPVRKYRRVKPTFDQVGSVHLLWTIYSHNRTTPLKYIFKVGFIRTHPRHAVWKEKVTLHAAKLNTVLAKLGWGPLTTPGESQCQCATCKCSQAVQDALSTWLKVGTTVWYFSMKHFTFNAAVVEEIKQNGVRIIFSQGAHRAHYRRIPFETALEHLVPDNTLGTTIVKAVEADVVQLSTQWNQT